MTYAPRQRELGFLQGDVESPPLARLLAYLPNYASDKPTGYVSVPALLRTLGVLISTCLGGIGPLNVATAPAG